MRSEHIKFCPICGASAHIQYIFGQDRPACSDCKWVYFADPKVAAAVLVERSNQVLLVQRANEPFRGLWTLPAGFVNAEEAPDAAAARECFEETGVQVEITGIIDIISGREHPRGSDFVIFYRGKFVSGEPAAADDAAAVGWFDWGKLPELAFKSTSRIFENH
jgi:8-oxo-dGTP diphosphatase